MSGVDDPVMRLAARVLPLDEAARAQRVQALLDDKTKPPGSLGRIEALALQLACVLGTDTPRLHAPQLLVCAADHGIARQGVSCYPQAVTAQMVRNMLDGGAAVSVLSRQHGIALTVADCGVLGASPPRPGLVAVRVRAGSGDSSEGPAMSAGECETAVLNGSRLVAGLPGNVQLLGEMGIANTSAAALLMARLTGAPLEACTGRGTGLDDVALAHKREVLARALARHAAARAPLALLAALGGLEIATLVGAVLEAAAGRRVVLVDGFITTAAVALAAELAPSVLERCVFAHGSAEQGHAAWLRQLGVVPLLELGLRLGEGSGAALAWPLLVSAERLLAEMASFADAGVSGRGAG